jgi:ubiquinone/menaquinone biosynthesis C-methylase UbiE
MATYQEIYHSHADIYDRLVSCEDADNRLWGEIEAVFPLNGRDIIELGAGSGRLTRGLAGKAGSLWAFDNSEHMIESNRTRLQGLNYTNCQLGLADHRTIPRPSQSADLVIAGWSLCYLVVEHPASWELELAKSLAEIERLLRPGGKIIIIETLGTGFTSPTPPDHLRAYYDWLENRAGLSRRWFRTDYEFSSLAEAESLVRFFFGESLAARVVQEKWRRVPECTGLWSR